MGWAPLHPSARVTSDGFVDVEREPIAPRAYVFVEDRKFLEPVHSETVVVNNTTIINKTVNITNIKIVNNNVVNEGPRTTIIERASGHSVQTIPVHELRHKQEAAVLARQQTPPQTSQGLTSIPARNDIVSPEGKAQVESERRAIEEKRKALEEEQRKAKLQEQTTARLESEQRAKAATMIPAPKVQQPAQASADDRTTSTRVMKALEINSQYKGVTVVMSKGVVQ